MSIQPSRVVPVDRCTECGARLVNPDDDKCTRCSMLDDNELTRDCG